MHRAIEKGMTYVEACRSLGFDLKILGVNRANSAGKRAAKLAEEQEIIQNGLILWYSYKML